MHNHLANLSQRILNAPLLIHQRKAEVILVSLADRLGINQVTRLDGSVVKELMMEDDDYSFAEPGNNPRTGYDMVGPCARIEVSGTLVQKLGSLRPWSGMTGYDGIRQNLFAALDDPKVEAIVLDIDSPGGEVAGCFDLVDTIYGLRGTKPIWAILDENAFSAAYAIASAADYICVPRTGGVGSIGVICAHCDISQALTNAGIKVTFITFGDYKADGHAEIPLSEEAFERFREDITSMGELFCETVARNRNISAATVRDMQAACFMGAKGVANGLADEVAAPDAAFRALIKQITA